MAEQKCFQERHPGIFIGVGFLRGYRFQEKGHKQGRLPFRCTLGGSHDDPILLTQLGSEGAAGAGGGDQIGSGFTQPVEESFDLLIRQVGA